MMASLLRVVQKFAYNFGNYTPLYRVIEKSHYPLLTHVLFAKINYVEIRRKKNSVILECWECPPRSVMHAFSLFLVFDATR
jgi:hypothetical protein